MLSKVIQSVCVAVSRVPPRRGVPTAAAGVGATTDTEATVGRAVGAAAPAGTAGAMGAVVAAGALVGAARSGVRRAQAARPSAAIEASKPLIACRRFNRGWFLDAPMGLFPLITPE